VFEKRCAMFEREPVASLARCSNFSVASEQTRQCRFMTRCKQVGESRDWLSISTWRSTRGKSHLSESVDYTSNFNARAEAGHLT
jgi:hypothetical protein